MAVIRYARGNNINDSAPALKQAASWPKFEAALEADRAASKQGAAYICGPLKGNGAGQGHRCREHVLPRRFLAFDLDRISAAAAPEVRLWFARYRGVGWETHSSTPEAPRLRVIIGLSRDADRDECIRIGGVVMHDLVDEFGAAIKLDDSTFRGEQPLFVPPTNRVLFKLDGEPMDVDTLLAAAPREPAHKVVAVASKVIAEGGRNAALTRLAGKMRRAQATREELEAALLAFNVSRCKPPLSVAEVRGIAANIERYAPGTDQEAATDDCQDARTIMSNPAKTPPQCIPDRVPAGLLLIVGKPKCRKSFLALQIGLAKARGTETLGRTPQRCRVLALLYEDNDFRVRERLSFFGITAQSAPENLHIHYQWPTGAQGISGMESWLAKWPDTGLIIVDVLQRFRGPKDLRQGAYEADYGALSMLHNVIGRHPGLTILVVHHVRKGKTDDPVESISGTYGIAGAADNYIVFTRRTDQHMRWAVHIGGRDWHDWDDEFLWEFRDTEGWHWLGPMEHSVTERQADILASAKQRGYVTPSTVAEQFSITPQAAHDALRGMTNKELLYNDGHGRYRPVTVSVP